MIEEAVGIIYADKVDSITESLEIKLKAVIAESLKLRLSMSEDKRFDPNQAHDKVIQYIVANFAKEDRAVPYKYTNLARLKVSLNSILTSKVKLRKVAMDTLTGVIRAELNSIKGVTLSEAINLCPLKVTTTFRAGVEDTTNRLITVQVKGRDGKPENIQVPSAQWELDEIKLQFVAELCELDLLNMRVSDHTHMIEIPTILAKLVDKAQWTKMWQLSQQLAKKTIFLEAPELDYKDLMLRSSWYYRTPELSDAQVDVINILQQTKYQFVDNALELIEDAYKAHVSDDAGNLPKHWDKFGPQRIDFFKEQIRASQANGGHYLVWKIDSANRMYTQVELGGFQTSPELRALVKVAGINNKVKYDFRNNVVQMYALLLKSKGLGKYVHLVDEVERNEDLRLLLAETLNSVLECDVFTKDNIKPLFMVWAYNAGKDRILDGVTIEEEDFFGSTTVTTKVKGLLAIAGAANTESNRDLLWDAFNSTVTELAPEIVVLKKLFKKLIKNNPLLETQWSLPDGTIAKYASAQTAQCVLYFVDGKGKQHQHTQHRKLIVENAKSAGLLPRVIHSFDAYVARQIMIRCHALGITVIPNHDSFTFDKAYEEQFFKVVDDIFLEILEADYLSDVVKELNTSKANLSVVDSAGRAVSYQSIWDRYGKLTPADLAHSEPLALED